MEQDKPFKAVEVVDSRTKQVAKVACMSCVRGHRTNSCGIPVCRSKVFWTVKRPGRPSNTCTCRSGASGRCVCVVAHSACPHKPKKGEKRSGECRCDEQGRYCCLIEPEQWDQLMKREKPTVEFFACREDMEAKQTASTLAALSQQSAQATTMAYSPPAMPPIQALPPEYDELQSSKPSVAAARFGMMGVGGPQGPGSAPSDVLAWQGQAPQAPQPFPPQTYEFVEERPCCQGSTTPRPRPCTSGPQATAISLSSSSHRPITDGSIISPTFDSLSVDPQLSGPSLAIDRRASDYLNFQFPSAICQSCGMNGCTCKDCAAVMQASDGSGAQCCGRKYPRQAPPSSAKPPQRQADHLSVVPMRDPPPTSIAGPVRAAVPDFDNEPHFSQFDLDHDFDLSADPHHLDFSDLLMPDVDPSQDFCRCGCGNQGP